MRQSAHHRVVFTPALPHLDAFLSRHVRSDHPLRHHPMWLGEEDLLKLDKTFFNDSSVSQTEKGSTSQCLHTIVLRVPKTCFLYNMDQLLPESEVCWQLPLARTPTSLSSMQPYKEPLKTQLEQLQRVHGFESQWWGTKGRWLQKGGKILPNAFPFALPVTSVKRHMHISLLPGAEDLLSRSFVSGKTGQLFAWSGRDNAASCLLPFQRAVEAHVQKHRFQSPLYFSHTALCRANIAIKPNADPLSLPDVPTGSAHADTGSTSSLTCHVKAYQQYYHLSQLITPDNYRIPLSVIEAERMNPAKPINGMTGEVLNVPELQHDTIMNSDSSELIPLITCDTESEAVCSIRDLESPHHVQGRSLWYLPHNVLEIGGMVDVNAVPVEAVVMKLDAGKWHNLYNVEQFLVPLEGYKAVGCITLMAQPTWDPQLHPPSAGTNAEVDIEDDQSCL